MATILSTANQKGGPGKTTTAINVASGLRSAGYRIHVLDVDPQSSFSKWNKKRIKNGLEPLSVEVTTLGLLEERIQELREASDVDIVMVDCPGNNQDLTTRSVELSDAVLSPVRATWADFDVMADFSRFVDGVLSRYPDVRFLIFHNAKHGSRNMDKETRVNLERLFKRTSNTFVLDTAIPDTAAIAEFGVKGHNIFEYAPKSVAARLYKKLTKEVVECLQQ